MDTNGDQLDVLSTTGFHSLVLSNIDNCRASSHVSFASPSELANSDYPLLLEIILSAGQPFGFKPLDLKSCSDRLSNSYELAAALNNAYMSGSFLDLPSHPVFEPLKNEVGNTGLELGSLVRSESDQGIKAAFEETYIGDLPQLFVTALSNYSELARGVEASRRAYNRSISVIQSSGMGKSRLVEEAAKLVFTIPINLREELPNGAKAYPPPDVEFRRFFSLHKKKSDLLLQAEYTVLFTVLFNRIASEVGRFDKNLAKGALAGLWGDFLRVGQSVDAVGQNRKSLYGKIVREAEKKVRCLKTNISRRGIKMLANASELDSLNSELRNSVQRLLGVLKPLHLPAHGQNVCYVYLDEAHGLTTKPPPEDRSLCHKSPYHNLGKVLSEVHQADLFFIFLSTNSHLQQFAPPASSHPSLRASQGYILIPPFTELPFDVFVLETLKPLGEPGKLTSLYNVCSPDVMSGFGRPMWAVHHKQWKEQQCNTGHSSGDLPTPICGPILPDVITFAMDKLTAHGVNNEIAQSQLAAISVRIGVSFDSQTELARQMEAQQVESHMRVIYAIPGHREYMRTGSPSEPVLAEAAARYLDQRDEFGIIRLGPKVLAENCQQGFLARGECGELCGRLLVTIAHDIAIRNSLVGQPQLRAPTPKFHRPVPVLDFLRALVAQEYHGIILNATPVTASSPPDPNSPPPRTLEQAFKNAYVSFSHFELAQDSKVLKSSQLRYSLIRGCAIQAKGNQVSIDAVIPIHMGSIEDPITQDTISAINLQFKNRKDVDHCSVDRSITVPDEKQSVISIIFELGDEAPPLSLVRVHHENHPVTRNGPSPHRDEHHYTLVMHGYGRSTFNAVDGVSEPFYRALLATDSDLYDFPRRDQAGLVTYLENHMPLRHTRTSAHLSTLDGKSS